ncbi:BTB/POZ and MATH domain-containing protein 2 [Lolium perenne]|uniref:BTB/POZ and MATH domain-containing protein 2 n=1 Tax=Lolium perenne TaxID=4522 RepID=UPI0021EB4D55|nr:BTB/POZ and MATH domain-containing protein 2-like [Lolium perenne]
MSSFAGVSVITNGKHCTTSAIDVDTDSGYHLLVVKNYSHVIQEVPNEEVIRSGSFMVGGHKWEIWFYPNGDDPTCADFISLYLCRDDDDDYMEEAVEVMFQFSFVDQVEYRKSMHIRPTETSNFPSKDPFGGSSKFVRRDTLERSANLKGDCFTIRCDIMVCNTHDSDGTLSTIDEHFNYLLQNKVGADVTFEVCGEMFAAHRCVLAARSKVFMAQLFGPMAEGTTSSVIQIKDMEAKVFAALLRFIYTDSFPEMEKENNMEEEGEDEEDRQDEDVMWLQDLLVAADRYDLRRLKFLCEKRLSEHINVSLVASTLALAEKHHCHRLKEACFKFIQVQSPKCLDEVMATDGWEHIISTHPSVLNELLAKLVSSNQKMDEKRKR